MNELAKTMGFFSSSSFSFYYLLSIQGDVGYSSDQIDVSFSEKSQSPETIEDSLSSFAIHMIYFPPFVDHPFWTWRLEVISNGSSLPLRIERNIQFEGFRSEKEGIGETNFRCISKGRCRDCKSRSNGHDKEWYSMVTSKKEPTKHFLDLERKKKKEKNKKAVTTREKLYSFTSSSSFSSFFPKCSCCTIVTTVLHSFSQRMPFFPVSFSLSLASIFSTLTINKKKKKNFFDVIVTHNILPM